MTGCLPGRSGSGQASCRLGRVRRWHARTRGEVLLSRTRQEESRGDSSESELYGVRANCTRTSGDIFKNDADENPPNATSTVLPVKYAALTCIEHTEACPSRSPQPATY
jgi:hypothetical protein